MEKLYQCDSCKHLYQEKVTECDCMPDVQKFNDYFAFSAEELQKVGTKLESFSLLKSLNNIKFKIKEIKKMLNV